ncbi:cupin domain-containing protein [Pseudomonas huanghezhanensis]|uniref:cupin domain-containing protein n=1 Tax=Pseudomonas huanghezhanensis TaxID=3002903 RepID=UPI00228604EC|nr:cupin domain-containing protein [Pseudomonas sp. BSw22131]
MHSLKTLHRKMFKFENNLFSHRLLPWPELNAPFEGSWCVIDAHTSSSPHCHHEYEIFIALKGNAFIISEGKKTLFKAGDVVHFPPNLQHSVINESDETFEMFSIWWDEEMARKFSQRHMFSLSNRGGDNNE